MFRRLKGVAGRAAGVAVAIGAGVAVAPAANAATAGPDYTALLAGVDFTTTIAAVLSIAALVVGVVLATRGAKIVIGMVRGG
ncbi:hypothetical protein [Paraburkholderia megapolitana]|uniref:Phage-related membrane protein n=1 Tax=Paraburkholderia megapolitana TaxID=420953 RepID=A0A1I3RRX8_9BURK|nr:hypothetical protein [Paraburkholderia megapolitana]SFJ49313.1 hypothetical protein SAMN05192543_107411 [Paraburkholderia megapolitana]